MKRLTSLFIILIPTLSLGQGFIPIDTIQPPKALKNIILDTITTTFLVDFNGDGKRDYICKTKIKDYPVLSYTEYWITSDYKMIKKNIKYPKDIEYFWLVNIDSDKEPEIFSASGWAEGVDYCFIDHDFQNNKDSILFYFNPVIINRSKKYWGYPWAIKDLIIKKKGNNVFLLSSFDHGFIRVGEIKEPSWQSIFPVICFYGYPKKLRSEMDKLFDVKWINIQELISKTHF